MTKETRDLLCREGSLVYSKTRSEIILRLKNEGIISIETATLADYEFERRASKKLMEQYDKLSWNEIDDLKKDIADHRKASQTLKDLQMKARSEKTEENARTLALQEQREHELELKEMDLKIEQERSKSMEKLMATMKEMNMSVEDMKKMMESL